MNIRKVYGMDTLEQLEDTYPVPSWADHDAFYYFVKEVDGMNLDDNFDYRAAKNDERIKLHLKAYGMITEDHIESLEYLAVQFDGKYIGLIVGTDQSWGWGMEDMYITDFQKYQAMTAYIRATYFTKPEGFIIGETTDIPDLDGRYGFFLDKRTKSHTRKEDV